MQHDSTRKLRAVVTDPRRARALARHAWKHFREDRCFDEAASLSYTSLLSLVPLLAVVFGIASAFPVFEQWSGELRDFIYRNLVPTSSEQIEEHLEGFIDGVSSLTLTGTMFLIVTALLLMMRIERSFNLIWRVPTPRRLVNKIAMYWAVLTLGPLALGAATALSAQPLLAWLGAAEAGAGLVRPLGIFALTWAAFCLMFMMIPNCRVPVSFAATGAFLSTVLFTLAKSAFVAVVSQASYSVIYGALASIPVFLLWLYVVWAVILLGASLAASLTTFSHRHTEWQWPEAWDLLLVYRLLGHLYLAQREGRGLSAADLFEREAGVSPARMQALLQVLGQARIVTTDPEDKWVLARDLGRFTLGELYRVSDWHLPLGGEPPVPTTSPWDEELLRVLQRAQVRMDRSLASLYDAATEEAPP
ncbi:MAG: YihY family inner membrane protein [Gammaproteobacteria bacterium]